MLGLLAPLSRNDERDDPVSRQWNGDKFRLKFPDPDQIRMTFRI